MSKELSQEELEKRERKAAERKTKQKVRQAERAWREREEMRRLNARLRAARREKHQAAAREFRNSLILFFSKITAVLKQIMKKTGAVYDGAAEKLSRFASKKTSLPVFFLLAFFCLWLTACVGGHNLFHLQTKMQFTFYELYLCDFSAGFCSRVIVGAVTSLFLDKVSIEQMTTIANSAVIVSFVLFALVIGCVLRKGLRERSFVPVLLAIIILFEPIIVQSNYLFLGTQDVYVLILFLCILCSYGSVLFYITAPVLSILALIVHYHYFFSFFPAVMALFVYDVFLGEKKIRRRLGAFGFGLTAVSSGSLFLYLVFFAKDHLKCTADEFYEHMVSRFDVSPFVRKNLEQIMNGNVIFRDYFDYYIFGYHKGIYHYDSSIGYIDYLRQDRLDHTRVSLYYQYFAYVLPVLIAFIIIWIFCAAREKGKRRLPYLLFAFIILALFPELFMSTDVLRWMSATLTCQFSILFAVYLQGDATIKTIFNRADMHTFARKIVCIVFAVTYISIMMYIGRALPMF